MTTFFLLLVTIATVIDGLLAGAGLDYIIKQLPARKQIGIVEYSRFFLASDLANGRFWYIPLGISAYVLNIISAITGFLQSAGSYSLILLTIAAACALVHAFGTSRAAPAGLSVHNAKTDLPALNRIFDIFAKWTLVRGLVGVPMFVAMLLALIAIS